MTTLPISDKQKQSSKWRFVNEQGRNVLPDAVVFQVSVTSVARWYLNLSKKVLL